MDGLHTKTNQLMKYRPFRRSRDKLETGLMGVKWLQGLSFVERTLTEKNDGLRTCFSWGT